MAARGMDEPVPLGDKVRRSHTDCTWAEQVAGGCGEGAQAGGRDGGARSRGLLVGGLGLGGSDSREGEREGDKLVPPLEDTGVFITSTSPLCRL